MSSTFEYDVRLKTYNRNNITKAVLRKVSALSCCNFEMGLKVDTLERLIRLYYQDLVVAYLDNQVVAFALLRRTDESRVIDEIAVARKYRRHGIGSLLINSILYVCAKEKQMGLLAVVPESKAEMHLLLKKMGFYCVAIQKASIACTGEDAYHFEFSLQGCRPQQK